MNGDGTPDLVALQMDASTQNVDIAIALGNGDGTFKAPNLTGHSAQFFGGGRFQRRRQAGRGHGRLWRSDGERHRLGQWRRHAAGIGQCEYLSQAAPIATPAVSTTALSASASSVMVGKNVTFTGTVTGPSGNATAPTGTVSFNSKATFGFLCLRKIHAHLARLWLMLVVLACSAMVGCGSSINGTPSGTYEITVTATAGSSVQSSTFDLTVP